MLRRSAFPLVCALLSVATLISAQPSPASRVQLTLDTSEADQVLAILALRQAGKPGEEAEWQKLFATSPYRRLKQRQQAIGERFHDRSILITEEDFRTFVLSPDLLPRAPALGDTLARWKQADLRSTAERILAYLPDQALIHAKVYPVIKPGSNSFVWELRTDPTIFLYVNPEVTRAKFENTVAHELHHIGLASLGAVYDQKIAALPDLARSTAEWMAAFGEGFAMLAAAGGPDVDPHAASTPSEHAKWDAELAGFDSDLPVLNTFFADVLGGKVDKDTAEARAGSFFGSHQGPWYTVGYRMAVIVEKRYGRPALIRTMLDFRCLLALYNQAAVEQNAAGKGRLPRWSDAMLSEVGATTCGVPAHSGA